MGIRLSLCAGDPGDVAPAARHRLDVVTRASPPSPTERDFDSIGSCGDDSGSTSSNNVAEGVASGRVRASRRNADVSLTSSELTLEQSDSALKSLSGVDVALDGSAHENDGRGLHEADEPRAEQLAEKQGADDAPLGIISTFDIPLLRNSRTETPSLQGIPSGLQSFYALAGLLCDATAAAGSASEFRHAAMLSITSDVLSTPSDTKSGSFFAVGGFSAALLSFRTQRLCDGAHPHSAANAGSDFDCAHDDDDESGGDGAGDFDAPLLPDDSLLDSDDGEEDGDTWWQSCAAAADSGDRAADNAVPSATKLL